MLRIVIAFFLFLVSCSDQEYSFTSSQDSKIVVEGWIEQGKTAKVLLSRSVPVGGKVDSLSLLDYAIRSAKVTVSDGNNEEVLKLKVNDKTIPPFVYTGNTIVGEVGRNYDLRIEYLDKVLKASTYIPEPVSLRSAKLIKEESDTIGFVEVKFIDPISQKNFYQISTMVANEETIFYPAFYGNLTDESFKSSEVSIRINRGIKSYPKSSSIPYFKVKDSIFVKLRTMDTKSYEYWNAWQNEVVNGLNPIFPPASSLPTNIYGGIGIWAGYGQHTLYIQK
ncbi:MAG: DUF4249 domain-containing protein [Flavobacteriales bacterium]|nr:DUF4249 domain-containing protein [Flavobacteriales bacterium]